ncbi:YhgE/Pip domain-containing protein [Actinomadura kijaniata]|uniref:YhgE/Pip domain-containing protein n=1 Tax=Actinomadura kijaniata TaxID=46161 RepID=UPI000829C303|nr:YhgE/Pip domain-containing protein [Actinomadura kijaniata]
MRLPALSTGGLELRRFRRNRLTAIGLLGLVMLPLLYAGLYLWSFWDPYGRLSHLPVALVVEDRPAKADGKQVHAGADLAEELEKRRIFAWKRVDAATADRGVRKGDYYMSLTIPSDFSTRLASPSGDGTPAPAGLRLQLNDSNNYVVGTVAQAAFKEVSAAAREKAIRGYFDQIFVSFGTLHGELDKAAKGADKLADGSGKAHEGAGRLTKGLGEARQGAGRLNQGAGQLKGKLGDARQGSGKITNGLGALQNGAQQVAAGNQRLAAMVNQASDAVLPLLRENAPEIRNAALLVAHGADALADGAGRLPAQTRQAVRDAEAARAELRAYLAAHPEIPDKVRQDLLRVSGRVVQVARQVDGYVQQHTAELRRIAADARRVERLAGKIAKNAPTLAARVEKARRDVNRLSSGAQQVSAGAGKLLTGSSQLTNGLGLLQGGAGTLQNGLGTLRNGLGRLADGSVTLSTALLQISDGSGKLATGLHQGTDKVPDYGKDERAGRADMMSDPVRLASDTDNKVPNYGTGFAPFFVPLALWVGAMLIYMMLRPVNQRAQAGNAPGWRVALAGWLPAVAIGIGQVLIVLAVLRFALGLEAANWPGLIALLALASASFLAVVQWVNVKFGPIGRVVALALLMLQLTSAAGTYPIETSPGFFQTIRPFLPMPWTVDAARRLISGGDLTPVWQGGAVLVAFLVGGLLLSALAVRHNRVWTMKRLHPVLKL